MIAEVLSFVIAFLFSFVGTIPPGTLNLSIIGLGLKKKIDIAWRMAIAAAIVEYPYAWIANPLAIPFWLAVTAYLQSYGWIDLSENTALHAYLLGVSLGSLVLFMLLAYLAKKIVTHLQPGAYLQKMPGALLILLGIYSLSEYIFV